eukprot:scaffold7695_cov124-Isochrysis_galbana.AAC.10
MQAGSVRPTAPHSPQPTASRTVHRRTRGHSYYFAHARAEANANASAGQRDCPGRSPRGVSPISDLMASLHPLHHITSQPSLKLASDCYLVVVWHATSRVSGESSAPCCYRVVISISSHRMHMRRCAGFRLSHSLILVAHLLSCPLALAVAAAPCPAFHPRHTDSPAARAQRQKTTGQ